MVKLFSCFERRNSQQPSLIDTHTVQWKGAQVRNIAKGVFPLFSQQIRGFNERPPCLRNIVCAAAALSWTQQPEKTSLFPHQMKRTAVTDCFFYLFFFTLFPNQLSITGFFVVDFYGNAKSPRLFDILRVICPYQVTQKSIVTKDCGKICCTQTRQYLWREILKFNIKVFIPRFYFCSVTKKQGWTADKGNQTKALFVTSDHESYIRSEATL